MNIIPLHNEIFFSAFILLVMIRKIILILLVGFFNITLVAQVDEGVSQYIQTEITDGDTLPYVQLDDFNVIDSPYFKSKKERKKWNKLMRNVIKVYPYAKITKDLLEYYESELEKIDKESDRKAYMKQAEEVLKNEFKGEIMKMTISQGKVLVKLIDRETGQTSYELIKELRSGFTAFMWNSLALLFGNNLKARYNPIEDYEIETIVQLIESGDIVVAQRDAETAMAQADLQKKRKNDRKKTRKEARKKEKQNQRS
jgi:hypothetical protein